MIASLVHVLVTSVAFWLTSRFLSGWRIKTPRTALLIAVLYSIFMAIVWRGLFILGTALGVLLFLPFGPLLALALGCLCVLPLSFLATIGVIYLVDKLLDDFEIQGKTDLVMGCILLSAIQMILRWFLGLPMIHLPF